MDFGSAFSQAFNTFQNKGKDFVNNLSGGINQIGRQVQAGYKSATLPVSQVAAGIGQRINNPWIASSVSPTERAILTGEQRLKESGVLEPGGDFYDPKIARYYQEPTLEEGRLYQSLYSPSIEKSGSAQVPWYARPRSVSTTPALTQIRKQNLGVFTPTARFQLGTVPFGVESPLSYSAGTAGGPTGGKGVTFKESEVGGPYEKHIAVHELLHTAARGKGGIPWKNFTTDFAVLTKQHPDIAKHFSGLDELHRTAPEELYAELGAFLGPNVFFTPMGKYYEGILNKPSPDSRYGFVPENVGRVQEAFRNFQNSLILTERVKPVKKRLKYHHKGIPIRREE